MYDEVEEHPDESSETSDDGPPVLGSSDEYDGVGVPADTLDDYTSEVDGEALDPPSHDFYIESLEDLSESLDFEPGWAEELIGRTFGGRYVIEKEIARGGMGVVFAGRQANLDRKVVVKILSKYFVDGPEDLARFEQEAMGLSKLQHANIVTIYDFGSEAGLSYIAMEHIDGETLEDRLARRRTLSLSEFLRVVPQILRAIGTAHDLGIIHRDIKPANVMLTRRNSQDDFVKVVDFGLVKLIGSGREITGKGLVGTFGYVSPEQILGEEYDARSDVYALGILMYHMLGGRKPFEDADGMAVLYKHVHEEPPPLPAIAETEEAIPTPLCRLIHQCLEKDPSRRPRDANDLLDQLVRLGFVAEADRSGPRMTQELLRRAEWLNDTTPPSARRSHLPAILMAGAVAIALTSLAVSLLESGRDTARSTVAVEVPDGAAIADPNVAYLDEAERLAEAGQWTEAGIILHRASVSPTADAALLARSVALENRVAVGQLLFEAEAHATAGRAELAIQRFEDVLRRDPMNEQADDRLLELRMGGPSPEVAPAPEVEEPTVVAVAVTPRHTNSRVPDARPKVEPKPDPAPKVTSDPKAKPDPVTAPGEIATPRLPSQLRVQNRHMLEQMLRRVESEVIDRNGFRALDVQNTTRLLFKAAAADIEAKREPTVSPRKVYYLIARSAKAGHSRDAIAAELEKAYGGGSLK